MKDRGSGLSLCRIALSAVLFGCCAMPIAARAADDASSGKLINFQILQGKWTGFGWFFYGLDERKRAKCQAIIRADGSPEKGVMDLTCKSEGFDIDASAFEIVLNGSEAAGKWTMRSHEVDGTLTGSVTENSFKAALRPLGEPEDGYGAEMTTTLDDKCHAQIKIAVDSPVDLKGMELKVRRC